MAWTPGELVSAGGGLRFVRGIEEWLRALKGALQAGLPGVLVREPRLLDGDFSELLQHSKQACSQHGAWFGVHDRAHLVAGVEADGLHLGFRSLRPQEARLVVGPGVGIGRSTHLGDDVSQNDGCDWGSLSPIYPTPSKEGLLDAVGIDALADATRAALPLWALGGLTPERVAPVMQAGAQGVMARGAILASPDPAAATTAFLRALEIQR